MKTIPNIKIIVAKCLDNWSGAKWVGNYTREQQDFLKNTSAIYTFSNAELANLKTNYSWLQEQGSSVVWNDGSVEVLESNRLMNENKHNFKGWSCEVGEEVVVIDSTGHISLGTCGTRHLGHWSNFNMSMLSEPIICPKDFCQCGIDLKSSKTKI